MSIYDAIANPMVPNIAQAVMQGTQLRQSQDKASRDAEMFPLQKQAAEQTVEKTRIELEESERGRVVRELDNSINVATRRADLSSRVLPLVHNQADYDRHFNQIRLIDPDASKHFSEEWKQEHLDVASMFSDFSSVTGQLLNDMRLAARNGDAASFTVLTRQLEQMRGGASSAKEEEIQNYMESLNMTRPQAIRLAFSVDNITIDQLGNRVVVDEVAIARGEPATGRLVTIEGQPDIPPTPENMARLSFRDLRYDPAVGTGFWANAKRLWNRTGANVMPLVRFNDVDAARRDIVNLRADVIAAYRSGGRMLAPELETLLGMVPDPNEWLANPQDSREAVASMLDKMGMRYSDDLRTAQNRMVPVQEQREASARAAILQRIIRTHLADGPAEAMLNFYGLPVGTPATESTPLQIGYIEDGYEYMGGPEGLESSWRKVN